MEIVNIDGNHVDGAALTVGKCKLTFKGIGNKLIFGNKVRLSGVEIVFRGSNAIIEFGDFTRVTGAFLVESECEIRVGARTKFNKACRLHASEKTNIIIGEKCLFANVKFKTSDSFALIDLNTGVRVNMASSIVVGDCVWISENTSVDKGASVGSGSIIGAGSVVIDDIPENCLAVGIPARVARTNVTWNEKLI